MRRPWLVAIASSACMLLARGAVAQEPPADLEPSEIAPPPRNAAESIYRRLVRLVAVERRGPYGLFRAVPRVTTSAARPWLPETRADLPPAGEVVRPLPWRQLDVSLRPLQLETINTEVAAARGNDGALVGVTVVGPWQIP